MAAKTSVDLGLLSKTLATGAVMMAFAGGLTGCGWWSADDSPSTTTWNPDSAVGVSCTSDLSLDVTAAMSRKGLCVDDTSLFECPEQLLYQWPHTTQPVQYLRLFKAFRPDDDASKAAYSREQFARFVKANNVKVLVGSQITCSEEEDEEDWGYVKQLLQALGKEHVLALAVGNELDQLSSIGVEPACLTKIWGGYLKEKTISRISEARTMLGNPDLPVTSVFTGSIVWMGSLFDDTEFIKAKSYFTDILNTGEKNYVFTFNFYPIFDPSNQIDADGTCTTAIHQSSCYDNPDCLSQKNLIAARQKLDAFVKSDPSWGMQSARFWIGELGWSAPKPDTISDMDPMAKCGDFFSKKMLHQYYNNFLQWDLSILSGAGSPEYVFYFTMRDALNYGNQEHFGLVESCATNTCKLVLADVPSSGPFSLLV